ncbi:MAG: hypothetical protein ACOC5D_06610 [Thermoplasmatota archaeon]
MNPISKDPDGWNVKETFESKKNTVKKIEFEDNFYIVKKYDPEFTDRLSIEKDILKKCSEMSIPVPKIIESRDDMLILEYISGDNCKELYDGTDSDVVKKNILSNIAVWLSKFHRSFEFKKRRGDSILANFILTDDKVYGIDFEESEDCDSYRDVADMCTSLLRLRPEFTKERFSQTRFFIKEYFANLPLPKKDLTEQVSRSLIHYSRYSSMEDIMKEWAEKIRSNGLSSILQN